MHHKLFLLGAASTYFKSLNDAAVRKKKGEAALHKARKDAGGKVCFVFGNTSPFICFIACECFTSGETWLKGVTVLTSLLSASYYL